MAAPKIESRVAALEEDVALLKQRLSESVETDKHWVDSVYGVFADAPDFLEACV
jgi:malonyl CoA-acyl carrier protein transacylase